MNLFHASVTAIFVQIFIKVSLKCKTKKLGMIYTILGNFGSFVNLEGADIPPQIRPRTSPECKLNRLIESILLSTHNTCFGW